MCRDDGGGRRRILHEHGETPSFCLWREIVRYIRVKLQLLKSFLKSFLKENLSISLLCIVGILHDYGFNLRFVYNNHNCT